MIKPGTTLDMIPYVGAEIEQCKKHAISLAHMLNGNVTFVHGDKKFMCDKSSCIEVAHNNLKDLVG